MIDILFLDLDDTILDFHKAERLAIRKTIADFGVTPTDEVCALYSKINKAHWEMLERKELTREQVLVGRFAVLFSHLGVEVDPESCARRYEDNLSVGHYFLPGAEEALKRLSKKYRLFLASNGTAKVQAGRLKSANISHYFEKIFVSQQIGANKPDIAYFDGCFSQIPDFARERTIMVGDSLTSDIKGGKNAGIATCWVAPKDAQPPEDIQPDYRIESISQLEALLETL